VIYRKMEEINNIQNNLKEKRQTNDYQYNLICAKIGFEIWKKIDGYDNYSVSNLGNVRNDMTNRILKAIIDVHGYYTVNLYNNCHRKKHKIHRLVALAFIPNVENKECVDHKDNDKVNNKLENLRWATHQENVQNQSMSKRNTSKVKGVHFDKQNQKWRAVIKFDGKVTHLGYFRTIEEATQVRRAKAKELYGDFLNSCEQ